MINEILRRAGFTDREITVYLAGLQEGPVSASFLAKKTGISRQNTYDIIEKLTSKGLVSVIGKRYDTKFIMENPRNISNLIERREEELKRTREDLSLYMPELESFCKSNDFLPKVKFYPGEESMKNLLLESLRAENKEIKAIISSPDAFDLLGKSFSKHYIEERIKREIKTKTIRLQSENHNGAEEYFNRHEEQLREVRYAKSFVFASTVFIYNNKVVFLSSKKENFGLSIESEEFKNLITGLFDVLWQTSKAA